MKEDGVHENFWTVPEMPWKRKEKEMDNEFKRLVLQLLVTILMVSLSLAGHAPLNRKDRKNITDLMKDVREYGNRLG